MKENELAWEVRESLAREPDAWPPHLRGSVSGPVSAAELELGRTINEMRTFLQTFYKELGHVGSSPDVCVGFFEQIRDRFSTKARQCIGSAFR